MLLRDPLIDPDTVGEAETVRDARALPDEVRVPLLERLADQEIGRDRVLLADSLREADAVTVPVRVTVEERDPVLLTVGDRVPFTETLPVLETVPDRLARTEADDEPERDDVTVALTVRVGRVLPEVVGLKLRLTVGLRVRKDDGELDGLRVAT